MRKFDSTEKSFWIVVKTAFLLSGTFFGGKSFFKQLSTLLLLTIGAEYFTFLKDICSGHFLKGCHFCFLPVQKNILPWNKFVKSRIFMDFDGKQSEFLRKTFCSFIKTAFGVSTGRFWRKNFFPRSLFFTIFGLWSKSVCNFAAKNSAVFSKLHFLCSGNNLRIFFRNFSCFWFIWDSKPRIIRKLAEKFFSNVVKTAFYVSRGIFWETFSYFLKKFLLFSKFRTLTGKFAKFFGKTSGSVFVTAFLVSGATYWHILGFFEVFLLSYFFRILRWKFYDSWGKFFGRVANQPSTCPEGHFEDKQTFQSLYVFKIGLGVWAKISQTLTKIFQRCFQKCIPCVHRNILWQCCVFWSSFSVSFWDNERNFFRQRTKVFWEGSETCIVRAQPTILREFYVFYHFRTLSGKFSDLCRYCILWVQWNHSISEFCVWKFSLLYQFYFWQKILIRVVKTAFFVYRGTSWGKFFFWKNAIVLPFSNFAQIFLDSAENFLEGSQNFFPPKTPIFLAQNPKTWKKCKFESSVSDLGKNFP